MTPKSNRINWLDTSRGLAFLMVIYNHLEYREVFKVIIPYYTPVFLTIFFFVSGYLTKSNVSFCKVLEQRTRTLLIPLIIFGLGGGIILALTRMKIGTFNQEIINAFKGVFYQINDYKVLWFIAALYVYSLIFYWVERWCKTPKILLIVCCTLFASNYVYTYLLKGPQLPWHIQYMGFGCFYLGLGKIYQTYENKIDKYLTWKIFIGCLITYFTWISITHTTIIYHGSPKGYDALILTLTGLIWIVYITKYWINNCRLLLFIGANTLIYFSIHRQILNIVQAIQIKMNFEPSWWLNIIDVIAIAIIIIIPTKIINKWIPQLTGKGFKLWKA